MLPAVHRLHRRDFTATYKYGEQFSGKFLRLKCWFKESGQGLPAQVGIVVGKKVAKLAVGRNQLKRQVRAILQRYLPQLKRDLQMIVTVLPVTPAPTLADLASELYILLSKAQVLEVSDGNSGRSVL